MNEPKKIREGTDSQTRPGRGTPRPATPERLEKAAYHYLERFATSAENLRRVLMRRVDRSALLHDTDRAEGARAVDRIIARFQEVGLLDDTAYAQARAASLHRQGKGVRAIRRTLMQKGVETAEIDTALSTLAEDIALETGADPGAGERADHRTTDMAAAIRYARRRRIGPYRAAEMREASRARDLAALGRQGFDYETARRVVEATDPETLESDIAPD
ncbi:RecX family transcriptional regulator [Marivibrio halodurans]|uniref:Regulatory protein RecX n=1 Tax=Marivibrio halodurans TaxID=2039722 RepID=A0A8J7V3B6_9PROT|nr:RecX family transcriptional regulator [Marivibrio halodurans]MBP5858195.1 RecX family transcriptional regulator [Marivibrio halodurans]